MSKLTLFTINLNDTLKKEISSFLPEEKYDFKHYKYDQQVIEILLEQKENVDCLLTTYRSDLADYLDPIFEQGILLPIVIFFTEKDQHRAATKQQTTFYHSGEQYLLTTKINTISKIVDQAIAKFLNLPPSCALKDKPISTTEEELQQQHQAFLLLQQRRLAEKLRERLGYLGVYYKRKPQYFYRNLNPEEQEKFKEQFVIDYREIVLDYFNDNPSINQTIDQFVNQAFFADISVSYILETHMKLMDEFAQQLKLEGRSDEILLDYRLTLIDIVAHLCEMYRRSIPREDLPFELLFRMD